VLGRAPAGSTAAPGLVKMAATRSGPASREGEGAMRRRRHLVAATAAVITGIGLAAAGAAPAFAGVQSITVFDCGRITSPDRSLWSPGIDVGVAHEMVASCYLIRHDDGLMMWDVGISDSVAELPDGLVLAGGLITQWVDTTLAAQMDEIGVRPEDVGHLGLSHMHPDHTGNANRFTNAVVYMQEAEYDAAFGPDATRFNFRPDTYDKLADNRIIKLNGAHDVFGDGSVVIMSAPGHTPGHQVLYVELPESGPLLLSGDLWHFRSNYDNDRVPGFNFDRARTRESIEKIKAVIAETGATVWIQHDKDQAAEIPHAPRSVR
jgi:N-acyl homoserine lactone hydrolase